MLEDMKTIYSYGIIIQMGMVVGFDHDDPSIFHDQLEFAQRAGVPGPQPGVLSALPGTPLYERMKKEGRLHEGKEGFTNEVGHTLNNIEPLLMSRQQLSEGFAWMCEELFSPDNYVKRVLKQIQFLKKSEGIRRRFPLPVLLLSLGWILGWFICDKDRKPLLSVFFKLVPTVLFQHFASIELMVQHLANYRHLYKVTLGVREESVRIFGNASTRWVPPRERVYHKSVQESPRETIASDVSPRSAAI
jgi:hypothetical protein